jgi:ketosteroid isomerase-like protein
MRLCLSTFGGITMTSNDKRDREAILNHIRTIFDAFIRRDRDAIRKAHTDDWTGFQGPSTQIERGIDAYMKNVEKSLDAFEGTGWELLDTEVQVYGDIAVVYYIARYDYRDPGGQAHSLPLRSIDIYRRENGQWNQAGSHITPVPTTDTSWGEST